MTRHDLHCVTERAVDLVRCGFSVSDATALAVMGKRLTADAVVRVESVVAVLTARIDVSRVDAGRVRVEVRS